MKRSMQSRLAKREHARLTNLQAGRHMIGQYDAVEMTERASLDAFRNGWAHGGHWNNLSECRNVLMLGARHKMEVAYAKSDHEAVRDVTRLAMDALVSIRSREQRTGKFGATADELNVLHALVETSRDFWQRQPATLFNDCVDGARRQVTQTIQERGIA